jgi:GT2 family glycosyltransferase
VTSFWSHFRRLVVSRPKHALAAAYWHLTRRKLRGRNTLRDGTRGLPLAYQIWLEAQTGSAEEARKRLQELNDGPSFTVLIHAEQNSAGRDMERSRRSAERQSYSRWSMLTCLTDELPDAIAKAEGDYIVFLRAGDRLADAAMLTLAELISARRPDLVYGDEDIETDDGRISPWFKPEWNAEAFLALDYLSSSTAIKRTLAQMVVKELGAEVRSFLDALLLRTTEKAETVVHLPAVLVHVARRQAPSPERRLFGVSRYLEGRATCLPGPFDTVRVQWPLPQAAPLVSIIIPTRDKVELLRTCIDSVLQRTDYPHYEILVVDNGSEEEVTLDYLRALKERHDVRVLRSDAEYNFSALNNLAVGQAAGDYLLLLNNDTEVISPEWLSEMMRQAVRSEVGAVGAKLLYEDGSLQHAGVVVGMGEAAGHAHRYLPAGQPGYFRQPHVAQFATAVTAACLLVERRKYEAVGGLDEKRFAIAYNDVDLCLKLREAGWRNVYTPHAILYHHESKSRGSDLAPKHKQRYMRELRALQERWQTKTFVDPLHSPNLDRYSETYMPNLG